MRDFQWTFSKANAVIISPSQLNYPAVYRLCQRKGCSARDARIRCGIRELCSCSTFCIAADDFSHDPTRREASRFYTREFDFFIEFVSILVLHWNSVCMVSSHSTCSPMIVNCNVVVSTLLWRIKLWIACSIMNYVRNRSRDWEGEFTVGRYPIQILISFSCHTFWTKRDINIQG